MPDEEKTEHEKQLDEEAVEEMEKKEGPEYTEAEPQVEPEKGQPGTEEDQ